MTRCCEGALRALQTAPALADARKRVEDAGCSFCPAYANGACLLVSLTEDQVGELQLGLEKFHVVALRADKPSIAQALRMVKAELRPKLREDHRALALTEPPLRTAPGDPSPHGADVFEEVSACHPTVYEFVLRNMGISEPSEFSLVAMSDPCARGQRSQPVNHRHSHWRA